MTEPSRTGQWLPRMAGRFAAGPRLASVSLVLVALGAVEPAGAQVKVVGPPPYSQAAAHSRIKSLLDNLTSDNSTQTTAELTRLLTWYRDAFDEELATAWQEAAANRPNLLLVVEELADAPSAASIVKISWRQQRRATLTLDYAPMLVRLMSRFADSAQPFLDDLQGNVDSLDLTIPQTETVCRILLDMPDLGSWHKIALQVLPRYAGVAQNLLAQDLRGADPDKREQATVWQRDLHWGAWAAPSQPAPRTRPPAPQPRAATDDAVRPPAPIIPVPETIGAVFFQDASGSFVPLERSRGVQRRATSPLTDIVLPTMGVGTLRSNLHYWEMDGAKSPIRMRTGAKLFFVVRVGYGVDPNIYNLFPLDSTKSDRRTKPDPKNKNTPIVLGLSITPAGESTYGLTPLTGLTAGEYCFSARTSNDCYCFGIDGDSSSAKKKR